MTKREARALVRRLANSAACYSRMQRERVGQDQCSRTARDVFFGMRIGCVLSAKAVARATGLVKS